MAPAPIVVFAYQRPDHIRRALESLKQNPECATAPVFVYCDGPRKPEHLAEVEATRNAVREAAPAHAQIVMRDENWGLARSIIHGVTEACKTYGRAVVVEDDLILSPGTLGYLNAALDRYADEDQVMHVSAYMFPVDLELPDAFFYREATCWGWATWARAWAHFDDDAVALAQAVEAQNRAAAFNVENSMFFMHMLRKQAKGEIDSWAIRWYASMFLRGGLALHPARSLVSNGGFDGTGEHSSLTDIFEVERSAAWTGEFPEKIEESLAAIMAMVDFRSDRFLPGEKRWPSAPADFVAPRRLSTGLPIDLGAPVPSRKPPPKPTWRSKIKFWKKRPA